jgi:ankyrin repeat protein
MPSLLHARKPRLDHFFLPALIYYFNLFIDEARCGQPSATAPFAPHGPRVYVVDTIFQAAALGDIESIRNYCKDRSAILSVDAQGWSPAHHAARHDQVESLKVLCEIGGIHCLLATDSLRRFPSHVAAAHGAGGVLGAICELGATQTLSACDRMVRTPAHLAAMQGHASILPVLHDSGADLNAKDNMGR